MMLRSILIFLLSLMLAIGAPAIANFTPVTATTVRSNSAQSLLQQGITLYDREQFSEAIALWQQANQNFIAEQNPLGQALTLSNLSLAYQQLGQLELAQTSIEASLKLLSEATPTSDQAEIYAKALNTQGKLYWLQNQLEAALTAWQTAAQAYAQAGNQEGIAIAQINQARALQALGFTRQSADLLQQIYQQIQQQPNELKAIVLRNLGSVLRQIGDLDGSRDRLKESLAIATNPANRSLISLELGNTEWATGDRLLAIGRPAAEHLQAALNYYQQAHDLDGSLPAQLNRFSLLIAMQQTETALRQLPILEQNIQQLPTGRTAIYTAIHFTESWMKLTQSHDSDLGIAQLLATAIQQAKTLNDLRAESYALGQLGSLYEKTGQWTDAQTLTEQALLKMETIQAPEIRYRWEWQLGRLAQKENQREDAIASYQAAIATLRSIRADLLSVNPDVQFSFRDNVEPVYREFIALLLSDNSGQSPSQTQLQQAIQTVDGLQLAELENYLGCTLANLEQVSEIQDNKAAIIYPILLQNDSDDRIAIIAQFPNQPNQLIYAETSIEARSTEQTIRSLRENLEIPSRTPEVLAGAKTLYSWIIKPLEAELTQTSVETLVFVLDGALRNVPMSILHDGDRYLIESYAVAIAPRLEVFTPSPSPEALRVSIGGVGIEQTIDETEYPPILKLQEEIDRIARSVAIGTPLINQAFTIENIHQQLQTREFSAIHWKTHGTFSSDPAETYVVAYQERITANTLSDLIQVSSRSGVRPLELLVLSACETASGDNRAVLGLAGLAARTGTRSVLSTLWIAQDIPNTEFMAQFYQALSQPGITKAEAVRQAQLALIQSGYTTPHIWGNYALIGNWL
ncbi:CHAT domain-containing protein [Microcoleus sp. FACHB-1515]|uniref:CHAT domain-containing protein n=1 Tax=Cyanophyceae TaxID=3028117 RepID=UPI0016872748|nr:CHAT domain-containing protein [Microcoleus sp. FACHB-1515]MBD2092476.1 CHAT domain-containing protein [Microcoleus sp. FACHB-1515]